MSVSSDKSDMEQEQQNSHGNYQDMSEDEDVQMPEQSYIQSEALSPDMSQNDDSFQMDNSNFVDSILNDGEESKTINEKVQEKKK